MIIASVSYGFTKNLGNFQSARVDCQIDVAEGENPDDALLLASAFVHEALDIPLTNREAQLLDENRRPISLRRS